MGSESTKYLKTWINRYIHQLYTAFMIRTQIYIPENTHQTVDDSGRDVMQALTELQAQGGPRDLSKNIDHYLYGGKKL